MNAFPITKNVLRTRSPMLGLLMGLLWLFTISANANNYCSWQANSQFEWIEHLSLGTISHSSGNNNGYADFTTISTDLALGASYPLTIVPGFAEHSSNEKYAVYIDYNQDGDFDDAYELALFVNEASSDTLRTLLPISPVATMGTTTLRVISYWSDYYSLTMDACGSYPYGEAEDYRVNLVASTPPSCTASFENWNSPTSYNQLMVSAFSSMSTSTINTYSWTSNGIACGDNTDNIVFTCNLGTEYNLCLNIVTDEGCSSNYCKNIMLDCVASFEYNTNNLTLNVNNTSENLMDASNLANLSWNFGDGTTGVGNTISHTYSEAGTYEVCLSAVFNDNCYNQHCESVTIINYDNACHIDFDWEVIEDNFIRLYYPDNEEITGTISSIYWIFDGEAQYSALKKPSIPYVNGETYEICLFVATEEGCTANNCQLISIDCHAAFTYQSNGYSLSFTNTSTATSGDNYTAIWTFGDGNTSNNLHPTHVYEEAGNYEVCVQILTNDVCTSTFCDSIVVYAPLCYAPTNVQPISDGASSITLNWDEPIDYDMMFHYVLYNALTNDTIYMGTTASPNLTISTLEPCTPYNARIYAYCNPYDLSPYASLQDFYIDDDCVWPGDVNLDNIVNMDDLLAWGLTPMNITGNERATASLNWEAQACPDWTTVQFDGFTNAKHTDCNGNGIKDLADADAIVTNFIATHNGNAAASLAGGESAATLRFEPINIADYTGDGINDTVFFNIQLQDTTAVPLTVYGIRYALQYEWFAQDTINIMPLLSFEESWLGQENVNMVGKSAANSTNDMVEVGQTRLDLMDASGMGTIARIGCLIEVDILEVSISNPFADINERRANIPDDTYVPMVISAHNVRLINAEGTAIPVETIADTVWVRPNYPKTLVQVEALLEGAYDAETDAMTTSLSDNDVLPYLQPYHRAPWLHVNTELLDSTANLTGVVDWVLLACYNTQGELVEQQAALLLENGTLVHPDSLNIGITTSGLWFNHLRTGKQYHIAIRHRNHVDVVSKEAILLNTNVLAYNFTTSTTLYEQQQLHEINGKYYLKAGDINGDGIVNYSDFNFYTSHKGLAPYYIRSDVNFDVLVNHEDAALWKLNAFSMGYSLLRY